VERWAGPTGWFEGVIVEQTLDCRSGEGIRRTLMQERKQPPGFTSDS
jgi:hypothetical protein